MLLKKIKQRGQALVLFALTVPLLFLFAGAGIDLGWYYLNVSRLQNAADAAVLAGALKLVEEDKTMGSKGYSVHGLTAKPDAITNEKNYHCFNIETDEGVNTIDLQQKKELEESRQEAHSYATKNLYEVGTKHDDINGTSKTINEWTTDKEVKFSATLYTRIMDANRERYSKMVSSGSRYYKVELTETIDHLFFRGFDPMKATVVAWAVIKPRDTSLLYAVSEFEKSKTIHNVLEQGKEEGYSGKWAHFQDEGVYYTEGDNNRTEVVNIHNDLHNQNKQNSDRVETSYTKVGGTGNGENLDSLNLDFRVEYGFTGSYNGSTNKTKDWNFDWDLRSDLPEGITKTAASSAKNWTIDSAAADLRVLTSFNFNYAWNDRNPDDLQADILWTHIENDPWWFKYGSSWNSVHQIVLNAKEDNTATATGTDSEGNQVEYYTERPFFIFYTGPEVFDVNSTTRKSQPVILNLYCDWNAILYMPNSPVIINGNGHKLTGFVIAKEYLLCKTEDDFKDDGYIKVTDTYNKTIFVKQENVFTEQEIREQISKQLQGKNLDYSLEPDDKGNLSAYKTFSNFDETYVKSLKKYRSITDFSDIHFESDGYNTTKSFRVATEDLSETKVNDDYVKVFVNTEEGTEERYIEKKKLPYVKVRRNNAYIYAPVYDLKIKKPKLGNSNGVRFVNDDTNADLESSDSRYINSTLREQYEADYKNLSKPVVEDGCKYFTLTTDEESFQYLIGDVNYLMRSDDREFMSSYRKVTLENGDVKYIKEETTAEDAPYYVKVAPDGATGKDADGKDVTNYIIVDNKGDLQTKRITPEDVLTVETKAENDAAQDKSDPVSVKYFDDDNGYTRETTKSENEIEGYPVIEQPGENMTDETGKYRSTNRPNEDYKIPVVERVYKAKEAFNLNEASCYSYFQIPELVRENYKYLNVDELNYLAEDPVTREIIQSEELSNVKDMFFTTKRAGWMD